jgi:hypothetical protein
MLYPVGLELPTDVGAPHAVAAVLLVAIMVVASAWGPAIAKVGSLWVLLAVGPHVFIEYFTASRYLYLPAPGYALLFAAVAVMVTGWVQRVGWRRPIHQRVLAFAAAAAFSGLCGWYAYQTVRQNNHFADTTGQWRTYHDEVTRVWPYVPPGEQVITIGGPFTKYDLQYFVLPAFAETTWGPGRKLNDYESGSLPAQLALASGSPYVGEYRDGALAQVFDDNGDR